MSQLDNTFVCDYEVEGVFGPCWHPPLDLALASASHEGGQGLCLSVLVIAVSDPHSPAPEIPAEGVAKARVRAGSGRASDLKGD